MSPPSPPRPYPTGWFRLAAARSLPPGSVRTIRAMGRDIVLFRTASGRVGAVDPICPHLGAHLGHGGRVVGESLRCPFHGLRYGTDGACTGAEQDGPPPRLRLASWPVVEWQGQIMAYLDEHRAAPAWHLPVLDDHGYGPPRETTLRLAGHVQDVAENGVDLGHFGVVHGYTNVRDTHLGRDGARLHSRFTFDRAHPLWPRLGAITGVFDTDIHGLGCSITRLTLPGVGLRARLVLLALQVEPAALDFTIAVQLAHPVPARGPARHLALAASRLATALLLPRIVGDALQDRDIWAHRAWLPQPRLLPGDAGLGLFRRWARQFYPMEDGAGAARPPGEARG